VFRVQLRVSGSIGGEGGWHDIAGLRFLGMRLQWCLPFFCCGSTATTYHKFFEHSIKF